MTDQQMTIIHATPRTETSKHANRLVRINGFVPGTLYSKGNAATISVKASSLPKGHTRARVIQLDLDGTIKSVLMREVQINPLNDQPTHFDFQEVSPTDKVRVSVPLDFIGFTREQEKLGTLGPLVRSLNVVTTTTDLPSSIPVDVSSLQAGESVRLFDLKLPKNLSVRTGKGQNVALVSLVASSGGAAAASS